tara:strand:+ start:1015 stop:1257 length:243 start_codon:yes stop_codon:yes gene_type:complete
MLTNGDLVRIPQGSLMMGDSGGGQYPPAIGFLSSPTMGIVLETTVPNLGTLVKVLMNDKIVYIENKSLQLVGDKNVRKAS